MQFRTPIPIPKSNYPIDYNSKIVSLGSCFAVNMAKKLDYFKFQNTCNPFGILFHPLAIEKFIDFAISEKQFTKKDIFYHEERWHSFDAHSELSNSSATELLENLNQITKSTLDQIKQATHFIITLGTAWVYRNIESDEIVTNCHKVPQKKFKKELLSVEEIRQSLDKTINLIQNVNPNVNVIFTVSPVRHLKDGFVENQWSKANLIAAIHHVLEKSESCNPQSVIYFPSYEIMMDELRDYRFYAEDMLHPNKIAIDYIWERFCETYFSNETIFILNEIESIQKALLHRPFNPKSESYLKFLANLNIKIAVISKKHTSIKF